jgi:phage shock protein A
VAAYGRTYSQEAAQAQLREFASAVVDEQAKVKTLNDSVAFMEKQTQEIENALRVARDQMDKLQKKGEQMVREKSLADLKAMTLEMSGAVSGMNPNAPLTGAMKNVNDLLSKMQERIDTVGAVSEVSVKTASGDTKVVTVQQALQQLDYTEREKKIDEVVRGATKK